MNFLQYPQGIYIYIYIPYKSLRPLAEETTESPVLSDLLSLSPHLSFYLCPAWILFLLTVKSN